MNNAIAKAFLMSKIPADELDTWGNWKQRILDQRYLVVAADNSAVEDKTILNPIKAMAAIDGCVLNEQLPQVADWLLEYTDFINEDPRQGTIITTHTGEPVLIRCSMPPGQMPFFSAKIYVPKMACSPVDWFAHGVSSQSDFGWRAILVPPAREEIIRRKAVLQNQTALVRALRVAGVSNSRKSVLVSVAIW